MTKARGDSRWSLSASSLKSLVPPILRSGSKHGVNIPHLPDDTLDPMRFRHARLDNTGNSIRLVHVYPAAADGIIRCDVRHVPLHRRGLRYAALSYRWGDPSPYMVVLLNGKTFNVHLALWEFLHHFSHSDMVHDDDFYYLWTDAICIDQSIIEEKNQQVGMMKHIFSSARPVLIWTGIANESTKIVARIAREMQSETRVSSGSLHDIITEAFRDPSVQVLTPMYNEDDDEHVALLAFAAAVLDMCNNGYWERSWVFQEVLLASNAILVCGHQLVQWKTWTRVMDFVRGQYERDSSFGCIVTEYKMDVDKGLAIPTLEKLVSLTARQKCFDPRDHIYSLLGLLRDREALFQADYALDTSELWCRVLSHFPAADFPLFTRNLEEALQITPKSLPREIRVVNARFTSVSLQQILNSQMALRRDDTGGMMPAIEELRICKCEICEEYLTTEFEYALLSQDTHIGRFSVTAPSRLLLQDTATLQTSQRNGGESRELSVVAAVQLEPGSGHRYKLRALVHHLQGAECYQATSQPKVWKGVMFEESGMADGHLTADAALMNHFLYEPGRETHVDSESKFAHGNGNFDVIWRRYNR